MVFSKSFPKTVDRFTTWEEVTLTRVEEEKTEEAQRKANSLLLQECIGDAQKIMQEQGLKDFQSDKITLAVALFEKRASHVVYWKEEVAKEKFDKQ